MPPLMIALNVAILIVLGVFAYAAFPMAHAESVHRRKARQKQPTLGRMNPHAMQRFLDDLANPVPGPLPFPFKDWRDTADPYDLDDLEVRPPSYQQRLAIEVRYVKLPLHQFRLEGDATDSEIVDALYLISNTPSEGIDA